MYTYLKNTYDCKEQHIITWYIVNAKNCIIFVTYIIEPYLYTHDTY